MDESRRVTAAATRIADAIARRDLEAIGCMLAPGFLHRTPGGETRDAQAFLEGIRQIPGEIVFVRLDSINVDLGDGWALVTGIQHARVRIEGKEIDDRRAFVDGFVKHAGEWRIRVAIDLPAQPGDGD